MAILDKSISGDKQNVETAIGDYAKVLLFISSIVTHLQYMYLRFLIF